MPCEVRIYAFTRMRAGGSLAHPLAECYFVDVLLLVAVTAFENAMNFIHYIENSLHGFVVGNEIQGIVAKEPQQAFIVRASEDIAYKDVINILDNLKISGARFVSVATERK